MTELNQTVVLVFILFCRVGGCFIVVTGFSSARVPVMARLFLACSVTLALAPILLSSATVKDTLTSDDKIFELIIYESIVGFLLGLSVRVFMSAIQFMGVAIALYIGMGTLPGIPVDDSEAMPVVGSFISLLAVVLFFLFDLHWEVLGGLLRSYDVVPVGTVLDPEFTLERLSHYLSTAFFLIAQISGPFLAYSLAVNLIFGLVNKMVPQVPAYFVSIPFLICGGLFALYFLMSEMMIVFFTELARSISLQ